MISAVDARANLFGCGSSALGIVTSDHSGCIAGACYEFRDISTLNPEEPASALSRFTPPLIRDTDEPEQIRIATTPADLLIVTEGSWRLSPVTYFRAAGPAPREIAQIRA